MLNPRFLYTLMLWLLLPYVFLRLAWRARRQPEYLQHIGARFGFYSGQNEKRPLIWLHTVSVGETRAAQSLISGLQKRYPDHKILLTHTTPTGRAASEQLYGDKVLRVYLPYDYPFAVKRFLGHFKPELGILMETEIWLNLINACRQAGIAVALLNARMSEKSARGYARFSRLTGGALEGLAAIAAQTADDAARLTQLGAKNVVITGNLKFDIEPPAAMLELGKDLRILLGEERKVFLAASTRDGEEALLLDAMQNVRVPGLLLIIVPRHPQRFSEVGALLKQRGISFRRRTEIGHEGMGVTAEVGAILGDSMGEMFAYYAAADLAFVGGSLLPYGGQNLIAACSAGVPVLVGPHTYNFAEATRLAVGAGAALQLQNCSDLVMEMTRLFHDPGALKNMREKCAGFVETNQGATEKSLSVIASILKRND